MGSLLPLMVIGLPRLYGAWHHVMTGVLQHLGLAENVTDHRLNTRTVLMNPVSRFIYLNMNYHLEHHMFTMVPYYHLPKLHDLIRHDVPPPEPSILAAYRRLVPVLLRQLRYEDAVIVPSTAGGRDALPGRGGTPEAPRRLTMPKPYFHEIRVTWAHCDPAGIVYTGQIPNFALDAINGWWEHHLGGGWYQMELDRGVGTPFVHMSLDFEVPITPRHRLLVRGRTRPPRHHFYRVQRHRAAGRDHVFQRSVRLGLYRREGFSETATAAGHPRGDRTADCRVGHDGNRQCPGRT